MKLVSTSRVGSHVRGRNILSLQYGMHTDPQVN